MPICSFSSLDSLKTRLRLMDRGSRMLLTRLKEGEVLAESAFTFEKYRRARVGAAVRFDLAEMARKNGFKRIIGYVNRDNPFSLKSFLIEGYNEFEEVHELRLLLFTRRKHKPILNTVSGDCT